MRRGLVLALAALATIVAPPTPAEAAFAVPARRAREPHRRGVAGVVSSSSSSVGSGKCAVPGEDCVCHPVSPCTKCDPFEMAVDREEDDPDWCLETGYKRRVHCVFTNAEGEHKLPQDTYESCSVKTIERMRYFSFEVVGAMFVWGANKRKALLYERIERRLRQQIDDVDVV